MTLFARVRLKINCSLELISSHILDFLSDVFFMRNRHLCENLLCSFIISHLCIYIIPALQRENNQNKGKENYRFE